MINVERVTGVQTAVMDYACRDKSFFNARRSCFWKVGTSSIPSPIVHTCVCARLHAPIHNVNQTYTDHGVKSTMQQTFYLQLLLFVSSRRPSFSSPYLPPLLTPLPL